MESLINRKFMKQEYDYVILGAGIFGLYATFLLSKRGVKILIIEHDSKSFMRASAINQARLHNGYHYPRSFETAIKTSQYYKRFITEFSFAINKSFKQIYAISKNRSKTSVREYIDFCRRANILLYRINEDDYFKKDSVLAAFETQECAFNYKKIRSYLLRRILKQKNVKFSYNNYPVKVVLSENKYILTLNNNNIVVTPFVINATYASVNQLIKKFNFEKFKIKYELCEIIMCDVSSKIKDVGLTIMDGPFFSLMPFGQREYHSLTSVSHTPHLVSYDALPIFKCQENNKTCSLYQLKNCNSCIYRPKTAVLRMMALTQKYLKDDINIQYKNSFFSIKPILITSENDDSRPTIIKFHSRNPYFLSILSGKISTIYDLEYILEK